MASDAPIPEGFAASERSSGYLDLVGPIYEAAGAEGYRIGLRIDERHVNARGFCHGGLLGLLADVHLGRLIALSQSPPLRLVTVNLGQTFLRVASLGQWLECVGSADHIGRRLATAQGIVKADGSPVLRAVATFQVVERASD